MRLRIPLVAALTGLLLLPHGATAQPRPVAPPRSQAALASVQTNLYADSWAVVIGINRYQHERIPRLRYAVNDARSVEKELDSLGFRRERITTLLDQEATKLRIETVLGDELKRQVGPNDRVFVFFAGHGMTDTLRSNEQEGYLLPVDADPGRLFGSAISMTALRQISDRLRAKHILYVVDACYSGYALFNRSIATDLLDEMMKKPAIQILTAGRQRDEAQERGGHGVFTNVLVRGLRGEAFGDKGWLALEELGVWIKQRVFAESNKKQLPQFGNLSGEGQFVFLRSGSQIAAIQSQRELPQRRAREEIRQELGSLSLSSRTDGVEVYLADRLLGEIRRGRALVVDNLVVGAHRLRARKAGHKDWERDVQVAANQQAEITIDMDQLGVATTVKGEDGAEMVLVPAGVFWMGSDEDVNHEKPRHRVRLDAFHIDKYEVTNALYQRFVSATSHREPRYLNESKSNKPQQPVVGVSWHDAEAYCRWAGKRLPSEAEWEKAARGPDERRYPWGNEWDKNLANSSESGIGTTAPVGQYPRGESPYGVRDMAGNVWEWVADWYDGTYYQDSPEQNPRGPEFGSAKVVRGGSWYHDPSNLRSSLRNNHRPDNRFESVGFRCAKGLP